MKYFSVTRYARPLAIVCVLFLLSACAATAKKGISIEERVNARWAALMRDDLEGAYGYLSPGYRSSVSLKQYQRALLTQAVTWNSGKYVSSKCEEATCDVKVSIGFTVYGAVPGVKSFNGTQTTDESWVLVDGNWYFVPQR
ncbi:MAG: hypothetical protein WBS20_01840 [Lysobacterales bacterium]